MIRLLAFRNLLQRPWRSALLLLGFAMGVSVMIVLLSVGEALVAQARDRRLVGGGEITVLPEGLDLEMLKVGGLGGIYFSIPNARFVQLQLLDAPRLAADVRAVAPQIEGKLVYLRLPDGREIPVQAAGDVPAATAAVGAAPRIVAGAWRDDDGDRRWSHPTPAELRHDIDHFHLPPAGVARPDSWAEWHYFNVLSADGKRWAFVSLIVAGDVTHRASGLWGGQVLVTTHAQGETDGGRRYSAIAGPDAVRFSTTDADLTIGASTVRVLPDGRYAVHAEAPAEQGGGRATVDLVVTPQPRAYFPGATLESGDFASGYAVAALRADASGTLCVAGAPCERFDGVQRVATVRQHAHRRRADREVGVSGGEAHGVRRDGRAVAPAAVALALLVQRDEHLAAPQAARAVRDIAGDDQRHERPAPAVGREHVEVVPLRPALRAHDVRRREVEVVDVVPQLRRRGVRPPPVAVVVAPRAGHHTRRRAHRRGRGGDLAGSLHRQLATVRQPQVHELPLDLRRHRAHVRREPRRGEKLELHEARVRDREVQSAEPADAHHLQVDPLGKHRDLAAADEPPVARLLDERLAHREQHDHHRHAHGEAEQQQRRAPRALEQVAEGEEADHGRPASSTTTPSRMCTTRRAASASFSSCVTTTSVVPSSFRRRNRSMISAPVRASSSPVGSSARSSAGRFASARAMATRCCSPPESCAGRWSPRSSSPTYASSSTARARRSAFGTRASAIGSSTFSRAVSVGIR